MNSKIVNFDIVNKIKSWNEKLGKSNNFVKIYREYINNPEG